MKLVEKIEKLLEENHPNELERLTGSSNEKCMKICHALYMKWYDKDEWKPERVGDYWVIFRNYGEEWIDSDGNFRAFDSRKEAKNYLKEFFSQELEQV